MNIGERVKQLRLKKNMTQEELATKLGYRSKSSVAHIENGRDIPRSMVVTLAEVLDTTPAYLMGWTDDAIKTHELLKTLHNPENTSEQVKEQDRFIDSIIANTKPVPLVGRVAAGLSCHAEDNIEGYILTDCELLHEGYEYFWLTVTGDSMEPELHDGDRVLVRQQDTLENECYAVVRIDGEDGVVKRVRVEPDKITLTSVNPYYPVREFSAEDMNNVAIVGPVLEVKRRFHP